MDIPGNCIGCGSSSFHPLHTCPQYSKLDITQRIQLVLKHNRCENCLAPGHCDHECQSRSCKICGENHHTTLHDTPHRAAAHNVGDSLNFDGIEEIFSVETAEVVNNTPKQVVMPAGTGTAAAVPTGVVIAGTCATLLFAAVCSGCVNAVSSESGSSLPLLATALVNTSALMADSSSSTL